MLSCILFYNDIVATQLYYKPVLILKSNIEVYTYCFKQ